MAALWLLLAVDSITDVGRSSTWGEDSHDLSTVVEVPLSPSNIQDLTSDLPIRMPLDTQAHRPPMLASMPRADAAPASTIVQQPPRTKAQAKRVHLLADARRTPKLRNAMTALRSGRTILAALVALPRRLLHHVGIKGSTATIMTLTLTLPPAIADAVTAVDIDLRPIGAVAIPPHFQTVQWTRRLVDVRLLQCQRQPYHRC
ncbi:hypothetical protein JRQ81_009501 [Phrynocephalus forsythii]|uniref:Secreted protein n=1 Tax=Phrynocephalus forsythii TaxID=171643 RepID=A0A9Q0XAT9_9SAUR|nr:hypothetical protein JRQ81_009501 [Phrynocephalus forsythii]